MPGALALICTEAGLQACSCWHTAGLGNPTRGGPAGAAPACALCLWLLSNKHAAFARKLAGSRCELTDRRCCPGFWTCSGLPVMGAKNTKDFRARTELHFSRNSWTVLTPEPGRGLQELLGGPGCRLPPHRLHARTCFYKTRSQDVLCSALPLTDVCLLY